MLTRDHRLDRAKGVLISLVVLGHLLEAASFWDSDALRLLQTAIYSFHMPAFVFLAGITAKSDRLTRRVLVFLVLLGTALPLYYGWTTVLGLDPTIDALTPYWLTWFLLAMAWWTLSVPLIERFPRALLAASVAGGLLGGIVPLIGDDLAAARTLAFWPFFVVGKLYGARILAWAGSLRPAATLGLVAAAAAPVLAFYVQDVSNLWFYGSKSFDWLGVAAVQGSTMRLAVDASAALSTVALLACIPRRDGYLATVGRHSLAVYLLHGFMVKLLSVPLAEGLDRTSPLLMALACVALAAAITWLLALTPFNSAIRAYGNAVTALVTTPFTGRRPGASSPGRRLEPASR
ncbi:acyltransferase family protein [Rothia sp. AR01]|uniref:Acyltransferase family protein n=1 Tax=Rothia santali TaxID=2949643 RepID=A0A9X2KJ49_9MICC|nr:acyltransferase family protein [Rothia santali]MCP3426878.1 acyltransferase family protein [Rothia santali]